MIRIFYCLVFVLSSALCLYHNFSYYLEGIPGLSRFWYDSFATSASSSLTWDLIFIAILIYLWMYFEAKKYGIRHLWLYYGVSFVTAIAPPLAIFLLVREGKRSLS